MYVLVFAVLHELRSRRDAQEGTVGSVILALRLLCSLAFRHTGFVGRERVVVMLKAQPDGGRPTDAVVVS